jgi:hypothetical protein
LPAVLLRAPLLSLRLLAAAMTAAKSLTPEAIASCLVAATRRAAC